MIHVTSANRTNIPKNKAKQQTSKQFLFKGSKNKEKLIRIVKTKKLAYL